MRVAIVLLRRDIASENDMDRLGERQSAFRNKEE
jgi:hypothetical protein